MVLQGIPAHYGIKGHEHADRLAKKKSQHGTRKTPNYTQAEKYNNEEYVQRKVDTR